MNSSLVTTGPSRLTAGSAYVFQASSWLNGVPWPLASATLLLADPNGVQYGVGAQVSGFSVRAPWTALDIPGTWVRAWNCLGLDGVRQISEPETFAVIDSPGTPFLP